MTTDALLAETPLVVYVVCASWLVSSILASILPLDAFAYVPETFVSVVAPVPQESTPLVPAGDALSAPLSTVPVMSVKRISPWITSTEAIYRLLRFPVFWATLFATASVIFTMAFDDTVRDANSLATPALAIVGVSGAIALVLAFTAVSPESTDAGCCGCGSLVKMMRVPYPLLLVGVITTIATLSGVDRTPDGYIRVPAETIGVTVGGWVIGAIVCGVCQSTVHPLLTGFAAATSIVVLYGGWGALLLLPHRDTYLIPITSAIGFWVIGAIVNKLLRKYLRIVGVLIVCVLLTGLVVYLTAKSAVANTLVPSYVAIAVLTGVVALGIYVYRWMSFSDMLYEYVQRAHPTSRPSTFVARGLYDLAHALSQRSATG